MGSTPVLPDPADRITDVLVSPGGGTKFHIPREDAPICATNGDFRRKSIDVYPPSHREWCLVCRRLWVEHRLGGPE